MSSLSTELLHLIYLSALISHLQLASQCPSLHCCDIQIEGVGKKNHMAHVQGDQLIKRSVVQGCVSVNFSAELMAVLTESDVDRDARRLYVDRG